VRHLLLDDDTIPRGISTVLELTVGNDIELSAVGRLQLPYAATTSSIQALMDDAAFSQSVALALRPLSRLRAAEQRSERRGKVDIHVRFAHGTARETALTLESLDRECRRIPPLMENAPRFARQREFFLPLPIRPERGGLRIARAETGTLDLFLEFFGELEDVANSSPVTVAAFLLFAWETGRISLRLVRSWRLGRDGDTRELTGARKKELRILKEGVELAHDAVDKGYSEIDFVGESEGVTIEVRIRR
jgi:hypothetical protein